MIILFCVFFSNRDFRPTSVVFQDEDGNALYTQVVDPDRVHNQKVCIFKSQISEKVRSIGSDSFHELIDWLIT